MFCKIVSFPVNYPFSFKNKLSSYSYILKKDSQYRKGILSMVTNEFGDGLAAGAGFGFANYIGTFNHDMTTSMVAAVRVIESITMILSYMLAAHRRDNAEFFSKNIAFNNNYKKSLMDYTLQLDKSALNDLLITAAVISGLALSMYEEMLLGVIVLFTVSRIPRVLNKGYEAGAYNSMKYTLGNIDTHQYQHDMTHSIGAIEGAMTTTSFLAAFSTAYSCCVLSQGYELQLLLSIFCTSAVLQYVPKKIFTNLIKSEIKKTGEQNG